MTTFDARGCLTTEGLRQLARAVPGGAPPELAAHVAECDRCQRRLLVQAGPDPRLPASILAATRPKTPAAPRFTRALGLLLLGLALALFALLAAHLGVRS